MVPRLHLISLLGCSLALAACRGLPEVSDPAPAFVEAEPAELDFGSVAAGEILTLELVVRNLGGAQLTLEELQLQGSTAFTLDHSEVDRLLETGERAFLPVTFAPAADGEVTAALTVVPAAADVSPATVTLVGHGIAPAIQLDPIEWTFEDQAVGCQQEIDVTITNAGSSWLEIQEVVFSPTSEELEVSVSIGEGALLTPGLSHSVTVHYTPEDELPDTGYLAVYSNDPANPEALATQYGVAHLTEEVCEVFEQGGASGADILWVVDNSCSMYEEQTSMAINFATFMDILDVLTVDYHVAVITTDSPNFQGAVPLMTPNTPDVHAFFADAVALGTAGSQTTQGLRMAWEGLSTPYTDPGGPNDGFHRDDARLHVIFVTDADDDSPDAVASYVAALQSLRDDPGDVLLHGALALPAPRYEDAVAMTGGQLADFQTATWMDDLAGIAWATASHADTFPLNVEPILESITVSVNGTPLSTGWYHDPVLNAVVFQPEYVPDSGDEIEICYCPVGGCSA